MANLVYTSQKRFSLDIGARIAGVALQSIARRSLVDNVSAVVSVLSPALGSTLATSTTAINIRVKDYGAENSDTGLLKRAVLYVGFSDGTPAEMIYNGTSFLPKFSGSSSVSLITGGQDFSLVRTSGWRTNPTVYVYGVDASANEVGFSSFSWVFDPGDDVTAPTLAQNSPAAGATLTLNQTIAVNITDAAGAGFSRIAVFVTTGGIEEVAHDGVSFTTKYSGSSRSSITNGYTYNLVRTGGWLSNPVVTAYARDAAGNELVLGTLSYVFAPDAATPVLSAYSPASGSTLTANQTLQVDVTDASTITRTMIFVATGGVLEVVWDGSGFGPNYGGSSVLTISGGSRYSIVRPAGWGSSPIVEAYARDAYGNELSLGSLAYVFAPDSAGPTVSSVSPANSSTLATSATPLTFSVLDTSGVSRVSLVASFGDANDESVFDGSTFSPAYVAGSTRSAVTNGYAFSLVRSGGWRKNPSIKFYARDGLGNESTGTVASYTYDAAPLGDLTPPVVSVVSPSAGASISIDTPLVFDVTDNLNSIRLTTLRVRFQDPLTGDWLPEEEVVYREGAFAAKYTAGSSTSSVTNGVRFSVRRAGGWLGSPTISADVVDTSGNKAV